MSDSCHALDAEDPEMETALGGVLREIDKAIAFCEGAQTTSVLGASPDVYYGAQTTKRALIDARDVLLDAMEVRGLGVAGPADGA